jgi:glycosyltransferase involved in cell wall biosynthesis
MCVKPEDAATSMQDRAVAKAPITVMLPVLNEEQNLPAALASVAWADQVIVVDSHSTDRTAALSREAGAEVVQFSYGGSGPKKKAWALANAPIRNEWLLILDGDERVTDELRAEIESAVRRGERDGYCIDREFMFMGRSMRCFRPNWNLRLFRHRLGRMEDLEMNDLPGTGDNEIHEHIQLDGRVGFLKAPLLHDDYRGLTPWLERHNKYATWEAQIYRKFRAEPIGVGPLGFLRLDAFRRKRVLRRVWVRLPLRPLLRFFTWYGVRRGFMEGRQGFVFCVLMAYYEFIIGAKLMELERSERSAVRSAGRATTESKAA